MKDILARSYEGQNKIKRSERVEISSVDKEKKEQGQRRIAVGWDEANAGSLRLGEKAQP